MEVKRSRLSRLVFLLPLIALATWTCDLNVLQPVPDNPFDPLNPDYRDPDTQLLEGPSGTATEKSVTFVWQQRDPAYQGGKVDTETYGEILYRYRLNEGTWSPWFPDTTVTLSYLDDTTYTFEVMSKYPTNIEEEPPYESRTFTMNAYSSALMFSPRMKVISSSSADRVFTVAVAVEQVTDMLGAKVVVNYDSEYLSLLSWEVLKGEGDFLMQNGGNVLDFTEGDTSVAWIAFDMAVVMANPKGISGSGNILELTFEMISGSDAILNLDETSSIRDVSNEDILEDRGDGIVYVW